MLHYCNGTVSYLQLARAQAGQEVAEARSSHAARSLVPADGAELAGLQSQLDVLRSQLTQRDVQVAQLTSEVAQLQLQRSQMRQEMVRQVQEMYQQHQHSVETSVSSGTGTTVGAGAGAAGGGAGAEGGGDAKRQLASIHAKVDHSERLAQALERQVALLEAIQRNTASPSSSPSRAAASAGGAGGEGSSADASGSAQSTKAIAAELAAAGVVGNSQVVRMLVAELQAAKEQVHLKDAKVGGAGSMWAVPHCEQGAALSCLDTSHGWYITVVQHTRPQITIGGMAWCSLHQ